MSGTFDGEFGVHFSIHLANHYTVPELAELGEFAHERGFDQVWVNDNLGYRNVFVVLSAIAARAPVKLGTGILVPYFRNPVDVADAVAALTELTRGQEVTVGLGRGSPHLAEGRVELPRPYRMLRETSEFLDRFLSGETIRLGEFELLTSYFNLEPDAEMALAFTPTATTRFLIGGHGDTAMTVGGRFMDGTLIAGHFLPYYTLGKIAEKFAIADRAAATADGDKELKHVVELCVSLSEDGDRAREYPKPFLAHTMTGSMRDLLTDRELEQLDVEPGTVDRLQDALDGGAGIRDVADLVTDEMVDCKFVAGSPDDCVDRLRELIDDIARMDVDQIVFHHLGPDYEESIDLLSSEVLPAVRG